MSGIINSTPQTPNITGGMPDNRFTKGVRIRFTLVGAYSTIYSAVSRHRGRAIIIAMAVTHKVPIINGKKPNRPFNGFQVLEVMSSTHESRWIIGIDL